MSPAAETPLRLSPYADRKRRGDREILVLPERALRLGGSGGAILALCDGTRSRDAIVAALVERHPGDADVGDEVGRFLDEMIRTGAVVEAGVEERGAAGGASDAGREPTMPTSAASLREPAPLNLIAELTYRCPLQCPYCSNPLDLAAHREALPAADWGRVFEEAAALGVVHVGLTGGEPSARADLPEIVERAVAADLYTHLVTAGLPLDPKGLERLAGLGLRSVQVSIQDATPAASDRIAGTPSFDAKIALCEATRALGLPLTLNVVLHRENLASVPALLALAKRLGADRLELANTQYHGWAWRNRAPLMPTAEQLETARAAVDAEARPGDGVLFVLPDYYADRPKPCMGGWGRVAMVVDPTGRVLPCHGAAALPGLELWNVRERSVSECWHEAPGMAAYRGTEWMPEPCASCPRKEIDFGGCRCQAFQILGEAGATDPACALSPEHGRVVAARGDSVDGWTPRRL